MTDKIDISEDNTFKILCRDGWYEVHCMLHSIPINAWCNMNDDDLDELLSETGWTYSEFVEYTMKREIANSGR